MHCMAFSSDGRFLVLSRPDAPIDVYEFPAFAHRITCWYVHLPHTTTYHPPTYIHCCCHIHTLLLPVLSQWCHGSHSPVVITCCQYHHHNHYRIHYHNHHREDKPASLEIRQLSFSPAHGNRLLSTVDDDGTCILWHWEQRQPLVTLRVGDAGFKQGRFNRCCFGGLHDRRVYTSLNSMGCGWVVVWQQTQAGEIQFVRKVKVGC